MIEITDEFLADLEYAANQATQGRWEVVDRHFEPRYVVLPDNPDEPYAGYQGICQPDDSRDCALIALCNPENILSLLSAYRKAKEPADSDDDRCK